MPTSAQHKIRGVTFESEPTGTCTTYAVVYTTGSITVDIHELIDRWLNDVRGEIVAIHLILPDPFTQPVWVHVHEYEPFVEFEITIDGADDTAVEEITYADRERNATVEHHVWVQGFAGEPVVPALPEDEQ